MEHVRNVVGARSFSRTFLDGIGIYRPRKLTILLALAPRNNVSSDRLKPCDSKSKSEFLSNRVVHIYKGYQ